MSNDNLRVLIIAENASLKFGGEAALPLHYFRVLHQRGIETWLLIHERTREELKTRFANSYERIYFIPDTFWHKLLWKIQQPFPHRFSLFTFGLIMRLFTQILQNRLVKKIVKEEKINIIHQPTPVSPKEPSMIFGMKIPVIIGPMNGGMSYPPAFRNRQSRWVDLFIEVGRFLSNFINLLIPGKLYATTLLVANSRTQESLPIILHHKKIVEFVENGVDLSIWKDQFSKENQEKAESLNSGYQKITKFVYIGRLVDWKAVDLLLIAVKRVLEKIPIKLEIIGHGNQKPVLEHLAQELGLINSASPEKTTDSDVVEFVDWLTQAECAKRLKLVDALILPSLLECGGAVVLEAMAIGKPVIATNWGGPSDYLDESCGILIDPTSEDLLIDGLVEAMLKLAQAPELRQKMGEAGRQKVITYFDWEKKVDFMLNIYQESLKKKSY